MEKYFVCNKCGEWRERTENDLDDNSCVYCRGEIKTLKEKLIDELYDYFEFNTKGGTYIYNLTRVKEAFSVGTMTLDDFQEIDDNFIYELADFIIEFTNKNTQ